jgi:hypothetical protein
MSQPASRVMRLSALIPSGFHRNGRSPSADATHRPPTRAGDRHVLAGTIGYALHGFLFLILAALAVLHFGSIFDFLSVLVAVFALSSLKQVWNGLRDYLRR